MLQNEENSLETDKNSEQYGHCYIDKNLTAGSAGVNRKLPWLGWGSQKNPVSGGKFATGVVDTGGAP
jgi:hypothetical protein